MSWLVTLCRNELAARKRRHRLAARIRACFDGLELSRQQFVVGGELLRADGEAKFYKASEIDLAIERVNQLMADLEGRKR